MKEKQEFLGACVRARVASELSNTCFHSEDDE
jgi:hypothetical protein